MIYTIYKIQTGQIVGVVQSSDIQVQLTDGQAYVEGAYNDTQFYIENGLPVEIPTQPSEYAAFDFATKQWVNNPESCLFAALSKRQTLLASSDWTQMPDVSLANKAAWATYRQALRDITAQAGYPTEITWPTPPQ